MRYWRILIKIKTLKKKLIVRDKIENKINPFKMKIEFRR